MILELLKKSNIAVKIEAADWKEVVEKSGELLLAAESIEAKYIEAMKNTIIENGPYVVIGKGVALLHARPEDGVKENSLSLVTLKKVVEFGNENNDPVQIAFAFGVVDNQKHIETISELSLILTEESAIDEIFAKESAEEILDYIKNILVMQ